MRRFIKGVSALVKRLIRTELKTDGGKANVGLLALALVAVCLVSIPNWIGTIYTIFNPGHYASSSLLQPLYVWLVAMFGCVGLCHLFQVHLEQTKAARRLRRRELDPSSEAASLPPGNLALPMSEPHPNRAARRQQEQSKRRNRR